MGKWFANYNLVNIFYISYLLFHTLDLKKINTLIRNKNKQVNFFTLTVSMNGIKNIIGCV